MPLRTHVATANHMSTVCMSPCILDGSGRVGRVDGSHGGGGIGGGGPGGAGGGLPRPHCAKVSTWVVAEATCGVPPCVQRIPHQQLVRSAG